MVIQVERALVKAEDWLSVGAAVPIVGGACGMIKMGMGGVQLISGIAFGILFAPPFWAYTKRNEYFNHAWTHIKNGAGNIVAGFIESFVLIGTLSYFLRQEAGLRAAISNHRRVTGYWVQTPQYNRLTTYLSDWICWRDSTRAARGSYARLGEIAPEDISKNRIITGQEGKFVRYSSLEGIDWSLIENAGEDKARDINALLQQAYDAKAYPFVRDQYKEIHRLEHENHGVLEREALEGFYTRMQEAFPAEVNHRFS